MASLRKIRVQKERKLRKHIRKSRAKVEQQRIQEKENREKKIREIGKKALGFEELKLKRKLARENERQRLQEVYETA